LDEVSMRLVLVGAANPETIRMIHAVTRASPDVSVHGFIDNDPQKRGTTFYGYPVFGGVDCVPDLVGDDVVFVNLITGSLKARYRVTRDVITGGGRLANFIHPSVDLTMTTFGLGNYVQEQVIVQAGVVVGDNSSIHMGALIGHETTIGNTVFIAHAVSVSGSCRIGDGCFIGTNATILPRLTIGKWSTIGAGAVVVRDVPDYAVVVGNPARVIRTDEAELADGAVLP
jgi:sugar O-acyltransferase (sialic acid O-acetyltransferase NeuD family)